MDNMLQIFECLGKSPDILKNLVESVPQERRKVRRIPGEWSIHEHACHLVDVQPMLLKRFKRCLREASPEICPYLPGTKDLDDFLPSLDLTGMLEKFPAYREELLQLLQDRDELFWKKRMKHPEYSLYTPYILLRHILFHDHLHMYRIEALWLTTEEYL
ncbi:MAG: DinB family protein [bacterium]|nr:DinB family protein [bacterium]